MFISLYGTGYRKGVIDISMVYSEIRSGERGPGRGETREKKNPLCSAYQLGQVRCPIGILETAVAALRAQPDVRTRPDGVRFHHRVSWTPAANNRPRRSYAARNLRSDSLQFTHGNGPPFPNKLRQTAAWIGLSSGGYTQMQTRTSVCTARREGVRSKSASPRTSSCRKTSSRSNFFEIDTRRVNQRADFLSTRRGGKKRSHPCFLSSLRK